MLGYSHLLYKVSEQIFLLLIFFACLIYKDKKKRQSFVFFYNILNRLIKKIGCII
jgi:hypothetical protein